MAQAFDVGGRVARVSPLAGGHINASFQVDVEPEPVRQFLLQRLNPVVFPDGRAVMHNVAAVTAFLAERAGPPDPALPLQAQIRLTHTVEAAAWQADNDGTIWRMMPFLPRARVAQRADTPGLAEATARAFGAFVRRLSRYDGPDLVTTIQHFHDTGWYCSELEARARADAQGRVAGALPELHACLAARGIIDELACAAGSGVPSRIAHNDAKVSNVLLAPDVDATLAVIDLDTVMPGSALHDVGDLLRSLSGQAGEEETDLTKVRAEPEFVIAVARGWLRGLEGLITDQEADAMVLAGCVITLEQAVRFLTDHLAGDHYYAVRSPGQNLARARNQLALFHSLSAQRASLERACRSLFPDVMP